LDDAGDCDSLTTRRGVFSVSDSGCVSTTHRDTVHDELFSLPTSVLSVSTNVMTPSVGLLVEERTATKDKVSTQRRVYRNAPSAPAGHSGRYLPPLLSVAATPDRFGPSCSGVSDEWH
jgi:hypothetical protein